MYVCIGSSHNVRLTDTISACKYCMCTNEYENTVYIFVFILEMVFQILFLLANIFLFSSNNIKVVKKKNKL